MRVPNLLLIAAEPATHRELCRRLRRRGCRVFEALTPGEARAMIAELEPDLVVQENPLPPSGGPGALRQAMAAIEALAGPFPRARRRGSAGAAHRIARTPMPPHRRRPA